jgi:hypothetical protein
MIEYKPVYNFINQEKLFYTPNDIPFDKLKILEHNYKMILSEIPSFDISTVKIRRNDDEWLDKIPAETFNKLKNANNWVEGWNKEKNTWYNYPLLVNNIVMCNTDKTCPKTIQLLKMSGLKINIAGYALLLPNTKLMVHQDLQTGVTNNKAAVNLMLMGIDSNLYVKDKNNNFNKYIHEDGKAVIFNSELEHYADNNGSTIRYILYMDISYDIKFEKNYYT